MATKVAHIKKYSDKLLINNADFLVYTKLAAYLCHKISKTTEHTFQN